MDRVPTDYEPQHADWRRKLGVVSSRFEPLSTALDQSGAATVKFRAFHTLRGLGEWKLESQLRFERNADGGAWRLVWSPAALHPEAQAGDRFARSRTWRPRGDLLDSRGRALTVTPLDGEELVSVGVTPQRVRDRAALLETLHVHLSLDPALVSAELDKASGKPDAFIPVADLERDRFQKLRAVLEPVPGIFFKKKGGRSPVTEGFAAHTLGRVGEVTAELLTALGPPYQMGDVVGLTGLERALETQLAGRPAGDVTLIRASGERTVLHHFEGEAGESIRTTLQSGVQAAAERALADIAAPAALVALDIESAEVLALVSRPLTDALHRALVGLYPPGSTFKIVTAEALIEHGMRPETMLSCPAEARIGHRRFRNFEGETLGSISFEDAFAHSCNTTFVLQAAKMGRDALQSAAARFGFGLTQSVGLAAPDAAFPKPQDEVELAAAAIGQGRVLATPLHMASVAAAAGSGRWRAPRLYDLEEPQTERKLSFGAAKILRGLMTAVVKKGTGKAAARVPGLIGKTGTAEYGTARPPATHAWFVGLYDDIAFAVIVEGGGVGGRVATPIAARFAQELSRGR